MHEGGPCPAWMVWPAFSSAVAEAEACFTRVGLRWHHVPARYRAAYDRLLERAEEDADDADLQVPFARGGERELIVDMLWGLHELRDDAKELLNCGRDEDAHDMLEHGTELLHDATEAIKALRDRVAALEAFYRQLSDGHDAPHRMFDVPALFACSRWLEALPEQCKALEMGLCDVCDIYPCCTMQESILPDLPTPSVQTQFQQGATGEQVAEAEEVRVAVPYDDIDGVPWDISSSEEDSQTLEAAWGIGSGNQVR